MSAVAKRPEVARIALKAPWPVVKLGDVVESMKNGIYKPASFYAENGLACLRMYNIGEGRIIWRDVKRMRIPEDEILEYELRPGDLLVNRVNSRELVGKSAVIPDGLERCIFESKNIRVRLRRDLVEPKFVSYQLLSSGSRYFAQNAQQVVGMASISQPQVSRFPLTLAPLPEQRRIVAEIEKQFTRLDAGIAALRRTQANLKRYRAAVLKAACEGRLVPTEKERCKAENRNPDFESGEALLGRILAEHRQTWRGRGKLKEPAAPKTTNLPPLPKGWTWASAAQLLREVKDGTHDTPAYHSTGIPFITQKHVKPSGMVFEDYKFISKEDHDHYFERSNPECGDILVSMIGVNRGESCIVNNNEVFSIKNVGLFKPNHALSSAKFIQFFYRHTSAGNTSSSNQRAVPNPSLD